MNLFIEVIGFVGCALAILGFSGAIIAYYLSGALEVEISDKVLERTILSVFFGILFMLIAYVLS